MKVLLDHCIELPSWKCQSSFEFLTSEIHFTVSNEASVSNFDCILACFFSTNLFGPELNEQEKTQNICLQFHP